jgi:hypothetical protein
MFQIDLPGVDVRSATGKLGEALSSSGNTLIAFGLVALIIWLGSSAFFWLFERDNNLMDDEFDNNAFQNIPSAMYYVAVFLVGEWGVVDFGVPLRENGPGEDPVGGSAASPAGKVLCMLLVVVGIALYGECLSFLHPSCVDCAAPSLTLCCLSPQLSRFQSFSMHSKMSSRRMTATRRMSRPTLWRE